MAEFQRMPTQEELQKILYMGQMQGKTTQEIINENLNKGGTIKPLPENFFTTASAGAKRAGEYINKAGTAADVAKLFPGYQPETKVTIPTGFNVIPQRDFFTGELGSTGIQTQRVPIGNVLQQIKPADVLGVSGAERAYGDIGAGKAPQPMDVVDTLGLGAGGIAAGKGLLGVAKATKNLPVGMSIQDVSKAAPSSYVPNVQAGQEMLVMHNISPSKLQYADKLGGLPVPSLGIGKASSPYSTFGDITLIAPKEFAQPSAKNPVFRSDAYTSRFPNINYQFDKKAEKAFDTVFSSVKEQIPTDLKYRVSDATTDWKYRGDSAAFKYKFLEEKGLLPNKQEYPDGWSFNNEAKDRVYKLNDEYKSWLNDFEQRLQNAGAVPKEKIYKGETYSGVRRYADANLDNLVKEMKGGAGGENWNYGVGNVRAVASPKFKNLKEIQANRGLLEDTQSINKLKDKTDAAYSDLLGKLRETNPSYDANDAMLEIAQTKNMSVLDREYGGVPDQLKANIRTFLDGFKNMPTEYFEVKPQRAVGIEEFSGAIIPKDAPQSVKDILSKRGITDVYEYATPEERAGLMQKFGKEMFAAAPVGLLAGQDQLELKKEKKPKK